MASDTTPITYAREIEELHAFFVAWFRGEVPDTEDAWSRVAGVLDDRFVLISPDGEVFERRVLLPGLRRRYGQHGPTDDFTIWTKNVDVRFAGDTWALVTYEEWQRRNGRDRGRLSTAVFAVDASRVNGLRWRHVHETWLPSHD